MIAQVDPSFASHSRLDQVVALIRQNASLEVKLASFKDVDSIQRRCLEMEEVGKINDVGTHIARLLLMLLQHLLVDQHLGEQVAQDRSTRAAVQAGVRATVVPGGEGAVAEELLVGPGTPGLLHAPAGRAAASGD